VIKAFDFSYSIGSI